MRLVKTPDKPCLRIAILDLLLFRYLVYAMQLKRIGVSSANTRRVRAIPESLAQRYCEFLDPVILRRSVATQTANASSICNFGKAKGRTYDHVLIYPVADMASWLQDASTDLKPQTRSKLYVAITRARFSAGFVVADNKKNELPDTLSVWKP